MDLKINDLLAKSKLKKGECTYAAYIDSQTNLLNTWQERYTATNKGEWSKKMILSVTHRYKLPLELDHYTSQFLTGHGDFRAKLYSFKLVDSPNCESSLGGSETVAHVLLRCKRMETFRNQIIKKLEEQGKQWPPEDGVFLKSKKSYDALR